jgi:hypothetical protein
LRKNRGIGGISGIIGMPLIPILLMKKRPGIAKSDSEVRRNLYWGDWISGAEPDCVRKEGIQ